MSQDLTLKKFIAPSGGDSKPMTSWADAEEEFEEEHVPVSASSSSSSSSSSSARAPRADPIRVMAPSSSSSYSSRDSSSFAARSASSGYSKGSERDRGAPRELPMTPPFRVIAWSLPYQAREDDVFRYFSSPPFSCKVKRVAFILEDQKGKGELRFEGRCFVEFHDRASLKSAYDLRNQAVLLNREFYLDLPLQSQLKLLDSTTPGCDGERERGGRGGDRERGGASSFSSYRDRDGGRREERGSGSHFDSHSGGGERGFGGASRERDSERRMGGGGGADRERREPRHLDSTSRRDEASRRDSSTERPSAADGAVGPERPKLKLAKRTVDAPPAALAEVKDSKGIFGGAKPREEVAPVVVERPHLALQPTSAANPAANDTSSSSSASASSSNHVAANHVDSNHSAASSSLPSPVVTKPDAAVVSAPSNTVRLIDGPVKSLDGFAPSPKTSAASSPPFTVKAASPANGTAPATAPRGKVAAPQGNAPRAQSSRPPSAPEKHEKTEKSDKKEKTEKADKSENATKDEWQESSSSNNRKRKDKDNNRASPSPTHAANVNASSGGVSKKIESEEAPALKASNVFAALAQDE